MSFLKKVLLGECSLRFSFWVMGCIAPTPIFAAKYYLREASVFAHESGPIFVAGRLFLWFEWVYFAFITVALWNASSNRQEPAHAGV